MQYLRSSVIKVALAGPWGRRHTGFTAGQEIEVEARIANGGSAISRSGDPFGSVRIKAGQPQRVAIEINQLKP